MTEKEREIFKQKGRKPKAALTFDEIKASPKELLTVTDVERVLGLSGETIRAAAREHPGTLGFPVMLFGKGGKQVRIPRRAFVKFLEGGGGDG